MEERVYVQAMLERYEAGITYTDELTAIRVSLDTRVALYRAWFYRQLHARPTFLYATDYVLAWFEKREEAIITQAIQMHQPHLIPFILIVPMPILGLYGLGAMAKINNDAFKFMVDETAPVRLQTVEHVPSTPYCTFGVGLGAAAANLSEAEALRLNRASGRKCQATLEEVFALATYTKILERFGLNAPATRMRFLPSYPQTTRRPRLSLFQNNLIVDSCEHGIIGYPFISPSCVCRTQI